MTVGIEPKEALVYAVYPFLLVAALSASWLTGQAAWRIRKTQIVSWWLLVATSIVMLMVAVDAGWYALYRLQTDHFLYLGSWADRTNPATIPFHASMRGAFAISAIIFAVTAYGISQNKRGGSAWVRLALRRVLFAGGAAYLFMVLTIFYLMSNL